MEPTTAPPAASPVALDNIPASLKSLDRWAVSSYEKVPFTVDGAHSKINDPGTWTTFEKAAGALDGRLGLALAIGEGSGLVAVDLDGCIENGVVHPEAQKIVDMLDSYTEVSVSGRGLHILVFGSKPAVQRPWTKISPAGWPFVVEMFDSHFLTITGKHVAGTPSDVMDRREQVTEVYYHVGKQPMRNGNVRALWNPTAATATGEIVDDVGADYSDFPAPRSPKMSDVQVTELVLRSVQREKYQALMNGDASAYGDDASRVDSALAGILSFYTQDPVQLARVIGRSALASREKNGEVKWNRADYRERTLRLVLEGRVDGEVYTGAPLLDLGLVPLDTIDMKPVPWLWPGYLPLGATSLFVGDPGNGKTLSGLDLLARVTVGAPWPDGTRNEFGPRNVIVLSAEDANEYTIRPRIEAAGGDSARVLVIPSDKAGKLSLDRDVARLRAAIKKYEPLAVLIDPLSAYMPGIDTYRDNEVRSSLAEFVALLDHVGVAAVAVVHMSKNIERNAMQRVLGSTAFTALSRSTFMICRDPDAHEGDDTRRLFLSLKFNLGKAPAGRAFSIVGKQVQGDGVVIEAPVAEWELDTVKANADEVLRQLQRPNDTRRELHEAMLAVVKDGPVTTKDAKDALARFGKSDDALLANRKKLGIETLRDPADTFSGPYYWLPPKWDTKLREAWVKERMALRVPPWQAG